MLSDQVRRLRISLQALYSAGRPLDDTTFQWLLLALVQLEDRALDVEERAPIITPAAPTANVIPFPCSNQPRSIP